MTLEFDFTEAIDEKDKGYVCQCCGQFVKRYTRSINSNMCVALIALYKNNIQDFVHLEKFMIEKGYQRCGDASYLVYYNFLEKKIGEREDGSRRNGMYRLTGRGVLFVEGKIKAHSKFKIFNNKFEGFAGEMIDIKEAIGNKFSYQTLMYGTAKNES